VTGPHVPRTGVQGQVPRTGVQGLVVLSRATHFPTCLGVVPGGSCFVGVLVSKSGNKSLFKSMNGLFHTLLHASPFDIHKSNPSHASPFDIHKSNRHLPCTVPGTNLIVATKCSLEYPQHITVSVQNAPREDDQDVGLREDTKAQLCPATTPCDLFSEHTGPVNRKVQPVETWSFEPTSQEASGCAYSTDLNVGTPWLDSLLRCRSTWTRPCDPRTGCGHAYRQLDRIKETGRGIWRREEAWGVNLSPGQLRPWTSPRPCLTSLHIFPPVSQIRLLHLCFCQPNHLLQKFVLYLITPVKFVNPTT